MQSEPLNMPEIGWFSSTWHLIGDIEPSLGSRRKTFTCGFSFFTSTLLLSVRPRVRSFDENHPISGRTPSFFDHKESQALKTGDLEAGATGGCGIGEGVFQGKAEKRARIGLRRGSWHRFETRFAVRLHGPEKCGGRARQRHPTQPASPNTTGTARANGARMFGPASKRGGFLEPSTSHLKRKKAARGRPSEHLGAYFATGAARGP